MNTETIMRMYETYKQYSKLTKAGKAAVVAALPEEDREPFELAMAYMKLFTDKEYSAAVMDQMAKEIYAAARA